MSLATADLSDAHPDAQVAETALRDFGGVVAFHGPAVTLKVFEDNALVRELLEEAGRGQVLVVDGGGSLRCALLGGNLAQLAVRNGWAGIVINGCVRDAEEISALALGVKALGTSPRRSEKGLHAGRRNRRVLFAGVTFESGFWVYADRDGLLVAERRLHPEN
jgi:regulator of ribonuclease activity A